MAHYPLFLFLRVHGKRIRGNHDGGGERRIYQDRQSATARPATSFHDCRGAFFQNRPRRSDSQNFSVEGQSGGYVRIQKNAPARVGIQFFRNNMVKKCVHSSGSSHDLKVYWFMDMSEETNSWSSIWDIIGESGEIKGENGICPGFLLLAGEYLPAVGY